MTTSHENQELIIPGTKMIPGPEIVPGPEMVAWPETMECVDSRIWTVD